MSRGLLNKIKTSLANAKTNLILYSKFGHGLTYGSAEECEVSILPLASSSFVGGSCYG